jgi:aryl-alcohol dehydrogenase-like predicted oxidoreductase
MNKRPLGKTGIRVSELAFGGVEIGLPYGIGVKNKKDMPDEQASVKLLRMAFDQGINLFDTARAYGTSETLMGKAFQECRDEIIFCTKCEHLTDENKVLPSSNTIREKIERSFKASLIALQTDYIDVYMLHDAGPEFLQNQTILNCFARLKESGAIRATGVSTYTVDETKLAINSGVWDVIQLPFNLMDQRQRLCFDIARKNGVGIMVRSVLFKGILTDRGKSLHPALKSVQEFRDNYTGFLNENVPTLADLATKFALSYDQISSVLIGIDRTDYLRKALAMADGHYLTRKELNHLSLGYPNPDFLDLPKWDRMGWL